MTRKKLSSMTKTLLAAALAVGATGVVNADDSSIGRFGGDSYAYFKGQPVQKGPSGWRAENPQGLTERQLQGYSGVSEPWHINKPVFTNAAADSTFKQTHPSSLTVGELQALSSEGPAWHSTPAKATSTAAAESGKETFADRATAFFRVAR